MKTRKYNRLKKHKKSKRGQKHRINNNTHRYKKHKQKMKITRRKRGGKIPLGPVVTLGVLALAAIVGPIIGTYMDESNIEKAKREADAVMKARAEALEDDQKFSESTNDQIWDEEKRERDSSLGIPDENEQDEDNIVAQMSRDAMERQKIRQEIGNRTRKQSETMIKESPYWDTSTGVAKPILDDQ